MKRSFYQDGLGTNVGKALKNRPFSQGYLAEQNTAICSVQGSSGQRLHAGGAPGGPMNTYEVKKSDDFCLLTRLPILVTTPVQIVY